VPVALRYGYSYEDSKPELFILHFSETGFLVSMRLSSIHGNNCCMMKIIEFHPVNGGERDTIHMLAADLASTRGRLDALATFSSANDRSIRARSKGKKPPV
jgi:hypothetical protein